MSYRRKLPKPLALDTPQVRAAINFVHAVKNGQTPDDETLSTLCDAFCEIFGGADPEKMFGARLGLVTPKGRPKDYGYTPADIVSAYIELRRRIHEQNGVADALAKAKREAQLDFVDIGEVESATRIINRDWKAGRATVESLTDAELHAIIFPYHTS